MKRSLIALAALAAAATLGGCVAEPLPPPGVAVAAYAPGYYYNGYPIYYDAWGYPIFYMAGVVHYVPRSYPHYGLLVSHYRAAPFAYRHWRRG